MKREKQKNIVKLSIDKGKFDAFYMHLNGKATL